MICEKCQSSEFTSSNYHGCQVDVCNKCLAVYKYYTDKEEHDKYKQEIQIEREQAKMKQRQSPIITCPYCKSTNTSKIGVIGRSVSFGLFGFGSSKVGKQWKCHSCKSDF